MKKIIGAIIASFTLVMVLVAAIPLRDGTGAEGKFGVAVAYKDSLGNYITDTPDAAQDTFKIIIFGHTGYAYSAKMLINDSRILDTVVQGVAVVAFFDDWQDIDSTHDIGSYVFLASVWDSSSNLVSEVSGFVYRSNVGQSAVYDNVAALDSVRTWLTAGVNKSVHTKYGTEVDSIYVIQASGTDTVGVLLYYHPGGTEGGRPDSVVAVAWP